MSIFSLRKLNTLKHFLVIMSVHLCHTENGLCRNTAFLVLLQKKIKITTYFFSTAPSVVSYLPTSSHRKLRRIYPKLDFTQNPKTTYILKNKEAMWFPPLVWWWLKAASPDTVILQYFYQLYDIIAIFLTICDLLSIPMMIYHLFPNANYVLYFFYAKRDRHCRLKSLKLKKSRIIIIVWSAVI